MDQKKLQQKIEDYLHIIETNGVGPLFDDHNPSDIEGNYLKNKILSQVHYDDVTDLTDEQYKKFIECDESRQQYFLTKEQHQDLVSVFRGEEYGGDQSIYMAAAFKYITTCHFKELNSKLDKDMLALQKLQELSFFERIKRRKDIKDLQRSVDSAKMTISDFTKIMDTYYPYIENNSTVQQCIKYIEKKNKESFEKFYNWHDFYNIMGYNISKIAQTFEAEIASMMNWYNRANNIATAVLTTMKLPPNLTYDEFIEKTRSKFSSEEDRVDLELRNYNIPTSMGGGIGAFASRFENLDKIMQKMKKAFDTTKFDQLTKKEIVDFAAQFSCQFVKIHPYANGNGRTSRMLIDYILMSNGIESPVLYTGFKSKCKYIDALSNTIEGHNNDFTNFLLEKYTEQFGNDLNDNVGVDV